MVLEKTLESPFENKEIKPVNFKGNQPWILIGKTDAEAETLVFWSSDVNNWLIIAKVPDSGKDWGQKEKRASEDEMASCHHWFNGHELGQTSRTRWGTRRPSMLQSMGSQSRTWLGNWTTTAIISVYTFQDFSHIQSCLVWIKNAFLLSFQLLIKFSFYSLA